MVKFLIDHNVPKSVGVFLMKKKYDVKFVKEVNAEMPDSAVVKLAIKEERVVLTNDKDFVGLAIYNKNVDMIVFDYWAQKADVRIRGLKKVLGHLESGFGILILE